MTSLSYNSHKPLAIISYTSVYWSACFDLTLTFQHIQSSKQAFARSFRVTQFDSHKFHKSQVSIFETHGKYSGIPVFEDSDPNVNIAVAEKSRGVYYKARSIWLGFLSVSWLGKTFTSTQRGYKTAVVIFLCSLRLYSLGSVSPKKEVLNVALDASSTQKKNNHFTFHALEQVL